MSTYSLPGRQIEPWAINDVNGDGHPGSSPPPLCQPQLRRKVWCTYFDWKLNEICNWQVRVVTAAIVSDLNDNGVNEIIVIYDHKVAVFSAALPSPQ